MALPRSPVIADWLPSYRRSWLRADLIAGLTLTAYAESVALAYASFVMSEKSSW